MITVIHANASLMGDVNTITVDLLCLVYSINQLKEDKPDTWQLIIEEFKRIANESNDNYEYEVMKKFIINLQDLY